MKIKYNAPATLTFSLLCAAIFAASEYLFPVLGIRFGAEHNLSFIDAFFTVPSSVSFNPAQASSYLLLFTHIFGHADWNHLIGNLSLILILGPLLESAYGSFTLALMILVTGFATGVVNVCFFASPLLGASGAAYMMVLFSSFTNRSKNELPLTFILVAILFIGREIAGAFEGGNVSRFAHLAGGICGSLFGFFASPKRAGHAQERAKKINARDRRDVAANPDDAAPAPRPKRAHARAEESAPQ